MASRTELVRLDIIAKETFDNLMELAEHKDDIMSSDVCLVNISYALGGYSADKTLDEISKANEKGALLLCRLSGENVSGIAFANYGVMVNTKMFTSSIDVWSGDTKTTASVLYEKAGTEDAEITVTESSVKFEEATSQEAE